ncbi:RNA recognition motif domain-containing protein [Hirsutella rhossiliensis]|uniref:RNA recognition motif domain-containing protein n=1 Tax=Hirsutella rhossiliensis TaxID=111463 RepID=A0A9P8MTR2_9HYPO|nr:RNA recognition motif domain-containing protein [Hirsutella rhossiliensis]KAH0960041.1 RNA recognition motif domain-containing protein [Hirsutella rhossiliensis]
MTASKTKRKRQHSEVEDAVSNALEDLETGSAQQTKRAKVDEKRSLFVRSLPPATTNETLADFFSQHFPIKHAVVVRDQKTKDSRGYGFVTFADAEDAAEAQKKLDKSQWDGRCIRVDVAEPRHRKADKAAGDTPFTKPGKPEFQQPATKLIVRNLPWSIKTSEQLSHLFRSFGKVKFADLPQTKGKLKGFGFVTLRGRKNAEKALELVNGKEIDGRTLAVDWAVDKETWERQTGHGDDKKDDKEDAESIDGSEASAGSTPQGATTAPRKEAQADADLQNFLKNHMQNLEEESDAEEEEDAATESNEKERETPRQRVTDNSSTVFIRNMPFTTTDEQLKSFFAHFGGVRYARVVIDKVTDKPAGTGFVCFFKQSDAKSCVKGAPRSQPTAAGAKQSLLVDENADPSGMYTLDGRLLQVVQAVNKEEANSLAENSLSKRREKDKRRLYLLSEGAIGGGSPLFDLLSPAEIQMRQASSAQRKKMVQGNPSLHLSLTRLAIRNIPRNLDSKQLKELARRAIVGFAQDVKEGRRQPLSKEENARDGKDVKDKERQRKLKGKGIVRQAKIVFESNQGSKVPEKSGAGKSRGYGFIEYTSHHWALMGMRYLNGHELQDENGRKQRIIAEFAIENAQVVQRRRVAEEKSAQTAQAKRTKAEVEEAEDSDDEKGKRQDRDDKAGGKTETLKQNLIARKRHMRKNKARVGGKK